MIRHLLKLVWYRKRANALVMTEIFLSFLVLFGVVTFAVSALLRWNDPLGFDWENIWVVRVDGEQSLDPLQENPLHGEMERLLRETKAFPQVVGAAAGNTPPYSLSTTEGDWNIEGRRVHMTRDEVTDDFASVMGMRVLRGRWFQPSDDALGYIPVVVDSDLAKAMYGEKDPIGQKFDSDEKREWRVVGVVPPYRKDGELSRLGLNMMFERTALKDKTSRVLNIVLRVRPGTNAEFEEQLTRRLHEVVPNVNFRLRRMERMRDNVLKTYLSPLILAGIVAAFLMSMVALGLTGVLWQNVTRRTRELGLRRALGASGPGVRSQILAEVALLATLSVVVGVIVVLQLPLLGIFAFVTPAMFTAGLFGALAVIYAITLLCGLYPSWLASRLEPAEALRHE